MILVTPEQMAEIDRLTIKENGMPGLVLMENAARSVLPYLPDGPTTVLVGPGNNGGDGLVIARALYESGGLVRAVLMSSQGSDDWQSQRNLAQAWGVPLLEQPGTESLRSLMDSSQNLVDALFGTGLSRPLEGRYAEVVEMANASELFRLAVDIPSGINGTSGKVMGTALAAHRTVTFGHPKWGHFLYPGKSHTGELVLTQPGFHPRALGSQPDVRLVDDVLAPELLPHAWPTMHKGDNGRLLLCTGSEKYPGAGLLSTLAALRAGGGLVTLWGAPSSRAELMSGCPEALFVGRGQQPDLSSYNALVLGCGLGEEARGLSADLLSRFEGPAVVDADSLPGFQDLSSEVRARCVITPHPGEMARLLGTSVSEVEENRIETARRVAGDLGCVVCLKGAPTVCADPQGRVLVNGSGNPVLAQGGSGDVLAGVIGAYLAFGLPAFQAAAGAAYVHGLAADMLAEERGPRGIPATLLAEALPGAFAATVG